MNHAQYRIASTLFTGIVFCSWLAGPLAAADLPAAVDAFQQNERLGRGVNIIGYDPLWRDRERARFTDEHFRLIKEAGFDSVRINLHPFRDNRDTGGQTLSERWLQTLDWAVDQALANKLMVILDFHEFTQMGEDPDGNKERFLRMWRTIAERQRHRPVEVLFEILNEPNKKLTPEKWNDLLAEALAIIRQTNPARTVVIGPAFWNSVDHLDELKLPEDDRNLIVTVHFYKPFDFTHQGASWTDRKDKLGIEWKGTPEEQQAITSDFDKVQTWAKAQRRPILLGEFGAYDKADMPSRVRWTSVVTRQAEKRGWSWAYWQFDGDFIVYNIKEGRWVKPIRDALLPPETSRAAAGGQTESSKKIVFLAGGPSHGYASHEHYAGCLLLAKCLEQAVPGVKTEVYKLWPDDPATLDDAAAIVIFCDGGGGNIFVRRLADLERLMKKGVGLACLHYAVEVPKGEAGERMLDWIGGYFEQHWSVNPHFEGRFTEFPDHPVSRGLKPFAVEDEWYYHMRFRENMQGVTPILTTVPPDNTRERPDGPHSNNPTVRSRKGMPEHVAWVAERAEGGRGFGFTGGHWHWNWANDSFRTAALNGIAWTAGLEIPAGGIPSAAPTLAELEENQDFAVPERFDRGRIEKMLEGWKGER
mgnify:CR=1 FL=1